MNNFLNYLILILALTSYSCNHETFTRSRPFPLLMNKQKMLAFCENNKRCRKYDESIGLSTDSIKICNKYYFDLCLWKIDCRPTTKGLQNSGPYFIRKDNDVIYFIANVYPDGKMDTVKEQLLFDFNTREKQSWTTKNFGVGNVMKISLIKTMYISKKNPDTVYVFDFRESEPLRVSVATKELQKMMVTHREGIIGCEYYLNSKKIVTIRRKWRKQFAYLLSSASKCQPNPSL
jgi:hypothetical protein